MDIVKRSVSFPGSVWDTVAHLSRGETRGNMSGMVTKLVMEALAARGGEVTVLYRPAPSMTARFNVGNGCWEMTTEGVA